MGLMHLKSGRVSQACDTIFEALSLVTLCEGTASLLTAEILEDLALAHAQKHVEILSSAFMPHEGSANTTASTPIADDGALGSKLFAIMIPATNTTGGVIDKLRELRDRSDGVSDHQTIDAMTVTALEIRKRKNGEKHLRVAHCLVRRAELFWVLKRYTSVIELYAEASEIFAAATGTGKSKPIAQVCSYSHNTCVQCLNALTRSLLAHPQLASWTAVAHLLNGDFGRAEEANKRAEKLVAKVFGPASWEMYRVIMDRVRVCQAMVDDAKRQGSPSKEIVDLARKAYSKAERYETQASILQASLRKDEVKDDVLWTLSHFAPIYRGCSTPATLPAHAETVSGTATGNAAVKSNASKKSTSFKSSAALTRGGVRLSERTHKS